MSASDTESLRDLLYDPYHPLNSPLLGRLVSRTVCRISHSIEVLQTEEWDEPWYACRVCGARFLPADAIGEDTEVHYV